MSAEASSTTTSKGMLWTGRVFSYLPALLLLVDGVVKLFKPEPVVTETVKIGFPESAIVPLGVVLTTCVILYLIPRTAVLGAILLTGYLGGAVATHVHIGDGLFPILFPAIFGAVLWFGLWLRDERLRSLTPLRK